MLDIITMYVLNYVHDNVFKNIMTFDENRQKHGTVLCYLQFINIAKALAKY